MSNGLCARCGSSGYGCYECTPKTYTRADMEAAIKRALEGAAECADSWIIWPTDCTGSEPRRIAQEIRAIDPAQFIEEPK